MCKGVWPLPVCASTSDPLSIRNSTISLWPVKNVSEFGVVDMKDDGNVIDFAEKPKPEDAPSNLINAGAYFLEPEVLDYIETGRLVSMEKEIFPQIINDTGKFFGFEFKGYWIDIGRISSYIDVHKHLLNKNNMSFLRGDNSEIYGSLKNSVVGDNVYIGDNTKIKETLIYDKAYISENVKIDKAIISDNCVINNNVKLKGNDQNLVILASYVQVLEGLNLIAPSNGSITVCHHEVVSENIEFY